MKTKAIAGILATLLMVNIFLFAVPTAKGQFVGTIKIGIIGPVGLPHYSPSGCKEAAEMARDEINAAGGLNLTDGKYKLEIALGNEYALPVPNPDAAKAELQRLVLVEGCKTIIGGFRTEVTTALVEEAATLKVQFLINGAATDELIDTTVVTNYAKYKYIFRINPVKSFILGATMAAFIQYQVGYKLLSIYGRPMSWSLPGNHPLGLQVPIAVLVEDLAWTMGTWIKFTTPAIYPAVFGPYVNVTYSARIPETATDMTTYLDEVDAHGCVIMLMVFSGRPGLPLIQQWGQRDMKALPYGINVLGQLEDHWAETGGECNLESFLAFAGTRTPVTGQTTTFWDNFVAKTGKWPIYTAWGAYDGLKGFAEAVNGVASGAQAKSPDYLVTRYESLLTYPAGYRLGLSGKFAFSPVPSPPDPTRPIPCIHDTWTTEYSITWNQTMAGYGYVRAFNVQWQNAREEVVSPFIDQNLNPAYGGTFYSYGRKYLLNPLSYPSGYEGMAQSDTVSHPLQSSLNTNPAVPLFAVDRKIDIKDIGHVTGAFWLSSPVPGYMPTWNPNGDLDGNQLIDIIDVAIVATDWGKVIPIPIMW